MTTGLLRRRALGDVVLLGSVTQGTGGCIVATEDRYAEVAERLRGVIRAVGWPKRRADLPAARWVDLQGSLETRWMMGSPRAAIRKHGLRRRMRLHGLPVASRPSVPALYARAIGVDHAEPPWFDLEEHIREVLLLAPGAAWAQKRWPAHAFSSVGLAWDGPVAVLGGPGEEDLVNAVARGCGAAFAWAGHGFDPIWDVLSRTAVAVAGDSGWMHLAGAAGARVVGLFGPTDPTDGFFVYPGVAIGRTDLACRPCALHRVTHCMRGDHACMEGIPAHQVMEAVRRCAGSS